MVLLKNGELFDEILFSVNCIFSFHFYRNLKKKTTTICRLRGRHFRFFQHYFLFYTARVIITDRYCMIHLIFLINFFDKDLYVLSDLDKAIQINIFF